MRAHLKDSDQPLIEGQDQIANCGAKVASAKFVFFYDGESPVSMAWHDMRGICAGCWPSPEQVGRYVYGIVNGEESKHAEVSA